MVAFLKKEYGQTGKGFEIDGNPISVWFDEYGMSIGYGTQAKETPIETMNWEDVERHIRSMVENGTYMDIREAYLVDTEERERVSSYVKGACAIYVYQGVWYAVENFALEESENSDGTLSCNAYGPEAEAALNEYIDSHDW